MADEQGQPRVDKKQAQEEEKYAQRQTISADDSNVQEVNDNEDEDEDEDEDEEEEEEEEEEDSDGDYDVGSNVAVENGFALDAETAFDS